MPLFTVVIRNRAGSPIEGEVSAATIDDAIEVARRMGHDVDEEATRKLAESGLDKSGRAASTIGVLVAVPAVAFPYCGLAAIILGVIGIEFSKGRRGWVAVAAGAMLAIAGLILRAVMTK